MYRRLRMWWQQPDGMREVLAFALPLIISSGSWAVMHFVDRMFLMWHSREAMTAALPAGMVSFLVVCFPLGLASYANTFVAQYFGAGRRERIGPVVWQGAIIALIFAPLVMATYPLAPLLFQSGGLSSEVRQLEIQYYQILCWSAGGVILSGAFEAFFTGRGLTRTVLAVNIAAVVVNISLDAVWIFGLVGFPEAGLAGAAWATVVAYWFKAAVLVVLALRKQGTTGVLHMVGHAARCAAAQATIAVRFALGFAVSDRHDRHHAVHRVGQRPRRYGDGRYKPGV